MDRKVTCFVHDLCKKYNYQDPITLYFTYLFLDNYVPSDMLRGAIDKYEWVTVEELSKMGEDDQ